MTLSFSFDHALTAEELAAVNELQRLADGQRKGGAETVRQAVATPAPTNTTSLPPKPAAGAPSNPNAPVTELTEADVRAAMER
ncbi:MAG: hypothetical protein LUD72_10490, partial [Bacteroidales bacterium]|nr:hypothetical protein [Bacteroidales bacterium]